MSKIQKPLQIVKTDMKDCRSPREVYTLDADGEYYLSAIYDMILQKQLYSKHHKGHWWKKEYDSKGKILKIQKSNGYLSTWKYNEDGRVLFEEHIDEYGDKRFTKNSYNQDDVLTKSEDQNGLRFDSITHNGEVLPTYERKGTEYLEYEYQEIGDKKVLVEKNTYKIKDDEFVSSDKRQYDLHGRLTRSEDSRGYWVTYEYDALGKVCNFESSYGDWEKTTYNMHGNITYLAKKTGENVTESIYKYDLEQRILSKYEDGVNTYYEYDDNGNLVRQESSNGYLKEMTYNKNNKIRTECDSSGHLKEYEYDQDGELISITEGGDWTTTQLLIRLDNFM